MKQLTPTSTRSELHIQSKTIYIIHFVTGQLKKLHNEKFRYQDPPAAPEATWCVLGVIRSEEIFARLEANVSTRAEAGACT